MTEHPSEEVRLTHANNEWVLERLRAEHQASIWSSAMQWGWSCSCGKGGATYSNGRASAARDAHLTAERKRLQRGLREVGLNPHIRNGALR